MLEGTAKAVSDRYNSLLASGYANTTSQIRSVNYVEVVSAEVCRYAMCIRVFHLFLGGANIYIYR